MSAHDDPKLRTAIAQFAAVMQQSPYAGDDRDLIDVHVEPMADGSALFRVTYTTSSVVAEMNTATGASSVRQGASVKVSAMLRVFASADPTDAIQMEIDGSTEPFDPTTARKKVERILADEAGRRLRAELGR